MWDFIISSGKCPCYIFQAPTTGFQVPWPTKLFFLQGNYWWIDCRSLKILHHHYNLCTERENICPRSSTTTRQASSSLAVYLSRLSGSFSSFLSVQLAIDVCSSVPIRDQLHPPTGFSPLAKLSLLIIKIAPLHENQEMASLRILAFALLLPLVCATNIKYCGQSRSLCSFSFWCS